MELLDMPVGDPFRAGENPVIAIKMYNGLGVIRVQLDPSAAPITVSYILSLVESGFYDFLKFHRIVPGFLIQGGDPLGTGDGETNYYVKGEFEANGVENSVAHTSGAISMARQEGFDTASCQFFIMLTDVPSMDGQYCAFGHVIEGMDVVERIADLETGPNDAPIAPIFMEKVYVEQ